MPRTLFISRDSYEGDIINPLSMNKYAYCEGNPLKLVDPSGNTPVNIIGSVIGAGGGAKLGIAVADHYKLTGYKRKLTIAGFAVGGAAIGWFAGPVVKELALKIAVKMQVASWGLKGVKSYGEYAVKATKNAKSNKVVLGKYMQGNVSYIDVAKREGATYFELDNWNNVAKVFGEKNMWNINEQFLNQQWKAGKIFYFSHNPWEATGYFEKEVLHLIDLGVKDFVEVGRGLWKAVK